MSGRRVRAHTFATVDRANNGRGQRSRMVQAWLDNPPTAPGWRPTLHGLPCPADGCHTIACGTTGQTAADRLAEHRRRCHG